MRYRTSESRRAMLSVVLWNSFLRVFDFVFICQQATTPWTLLEAGFNFNHTKDLLRPAARPAAPSLVGAQKTDVVSDEKKTKLEPGPICNERAVSADHLAHCFRHSARVEGFHVKTPLACFCCAFSDC